MIYSTLEHYGYTQPLTSRYNAQEEWQGQRSCKFPRSFPIMPPKDLIKTNFDLPEQPSRRGRSHYYQPSSFQKPFRSSIQKVPQIEHWHLRESRIRSIDFKPSPAHQRRQMRHNNEINHNPQSQRLQSLRTFYPSNSQTQREYGVEDRMQRKVRVDQVQQRKTYRRNHFK